MNFNDKPIKGSCILLLFLFLFSTCSERKLAILGHRYVEHGDTIYAQIPDFQLDNQFGNQTGKATLKNKIHISNFFFTSCPTICPKTMRSMVKISRHFQDNDQINYLCFSVDYRKDSVPRLKSYYDKLSVNNPNFFLLHIPTKEDVKRIAEAYMSIAMEDPTAPGGIDHSGWLLLVDKNFYLRSYCLGTDDEDVDRFIKDIELLLNEN